MAVCTLEDVKKELATKKVAKNSEARVLVNGKTRTIKTKRKLSPKAITEVDKFIKIAEKETERDTDQALQAFCHNMNSLRSRAANQTPFSSVNFGLDQSEAGRLVSRCLCERLAKGSGNGETFIYPIAIFHTMTGVNYLPGDPNYDIFQAAIRCSSKRLFPNFNFVDSPYQLQYIRDKSGRLYWKAREDFYVKQGLITREELDALPTTDDGMDTNLFKRIRLVNKLDTQLRQNKKTPPEKLFNTSEFMNGTSNPTLIRKAHKKGSQYPVDIDDLRAGFDDRTTPSRMGCRTYVEGDVLVRCDSTTEPGKTYKFKRNERPPYGVTAGRGNFSFVTLNFPRYAIEAVKRVGAKPGEKLSPEQQAKAENEFYTILLRYMITAKDILQFREKVIANKIGKNFQYVIGQDLILGSNEINELDKTKEIWDHFSKSIGFIGVHEACLLLYGKDHTEAIEQGKYMVKFIRKTTDMMSKGYYALPTSVGLQDNNWPHQIFDTHETNFCHNKPIKSQWDIKFQVFNNNDNKPIYLKNSRNSTKLKKANWSCFASPAESTCGGLLRADKKEYGTIPRVTDKEYYTNSAHVNVEKEITVNDKMRIESPYHNYCNAGTIAYIETDGYIGENPRAFEEILRIQHDNELSYAAENFACDFCNSCNYQGVIPEGQPCPSCGETNEDNIIRIRRITGYLVGGLTKFNKAKRDEVRHRKQHKIR